MKPSGLETARQLVHADACSVLRDRTDLLDNLRGKHIFITGGTGFLGTWLLELLLVLNNDYNFQTQVTVLSRSTHRFFDRSPHFCELEWINFQEGDIRHYIDLPRNTNFVIHAAAITDQRAFSSQPSYVAEVNAIGTSRLFKSCALLDHLEKCLLLSSGLTYGIQPNGVDRIKEDHAGHVKFNQITSVYAESKRMAEIFASCASSESKLPVTVVRPFTFIGPHQSLYLPWAITNFIRDCLSGGPLRIMSDGSPIRSVLYASDFAFSVLSATAIGKSKAAYNIGNPDPIDLVSLASLIARNFSPIPEIQTCVGQAFGERSRLVPDVSLANAEIGFKVTVPIELAITRTIEWYRMTSN